MYRGRAGGGALSASFIVAARDGLALSVRHHAPPSDTHDAPAVLLLHGLASSGLGFELPGRAFAPWLAARGAHVFVAEMRGHGASARPVQPWRLDDYLTQDLPALIDALRARAGVETVRWLGHSMGGILLLTYASLHPDAPIARGVTVGSALDYTTGASGFRALLPLLRARALLGRVPNLPYHHYARLLAPLLGRAAFFHPDRFNFATGSTEVDLVRAVYRGGFDSVPVPLLFQLAGLFTAEGLQVGDERLRVLDHARNYRVPTLMVAGAADEQVSVEAARATARLLGARLRVFSRAEGDSADYGHWDLLVGRNAEREVWPTLAASLLER